MITSTSNATEKRQAYCRPVPKPRRSLLTNSTSYNNNSSNHSSFERQQETNNDAAGESPKNICSQPPTTMLTFSSENSTITFSPKLSPPPLSSPPQCPIQFFPHTPPPLPPRNTSSQLPPPVIMKDSKVAPIHLEMAETSSSLLDPVPSNNVNGSHTVHALADYMNAASSISSECSVSCSSQSYGNSVEDGHSLAKTADSFDEFCDFNNSFNNGCTTSNNTNSVNIISSDCKSAGESVCFSGWIRFTSLPFSFSLKKEFENRRKCWAVIRFNQLSFMKSDETMTPFFGPFDLYRCIFVGREVENRAEISVIFRESTLAALNNAGKTSTYQPWSCIKFLPEDNIEYWLVFLAKCHSPQVDVVQNSLDKVDVCGKLWIRQGISGMWTEGWANIHNRVLTYWIQGQSALLESDIRKMILVKRDVPMADYCNFIENSTSGPILIALDGSSLYLQAECDLCTNLWFDFLNAALKVNGSVLEENRLTADNVPVIVDKCIRLVATYGLNQPGIYRRNGSTALARDLLKDFREDPFNVRMESVTDESINAVADILRSFFRQLEKPLIPEAVHETLYSIAESKSNDSQKVGCYHDAIFELPVVYFSTIKRLLAHLQQITSRSDKNLATIENISKIFGPTIFTGHNPGEQISIETYAKAARQSLVMRDLLTKFDDIFQTTAEEITAKSKLDEIQEQKQNPKARAEGFLVPIHLFQKDNKCFNVQCEWTAAQVVSFRVEKLLVSSDASLVDAYALFEVIRGGRLERRISGDETLKSIVLGRWLEWENAATNCYLLLKKDPYPFQPQNVRPFADNIKFAEPSSKSFKTSQLRVECGTKVVQYSKTMKLLNEWVVDEMLWFVGHEVDRKPPYPFSLTFFLIGKNATKYNSKFAGHCVAFKDEVQRTQWLNSVIVCRQEYLPMPLIQI